MEPVGKRQHTSAPRRIDWRDEERGGRVHGPWLQSNAQRFLCGQLSRYRRSDGLYHHARCRRPNHQGVDEPHRRLPGLPLHAVGLRQRHAGHHARRLPRPGGHRHNLHGLRHALGRAHRHDVQQAHPAAPSLPRGARAARNQGARGTAAHDSPRARHDCRRTGAGEDRQPRSRRVGQSLRALQQQDNAHQHRGHRLCHQTLRQAVLGRAVGYRGLCRLDIRRALLGDGKDDRD